MLIYFVSSVVVVFDTVRAALGCKSIDLEVSAGEAHHPCSPSPHPELQPRRMVGNPALDCRSVGTEARIGLSYIYLEIEGDDLRREATFNYIPVITIICPHPPFANHRLHYSPTQPPVYIPKSIVKQTPIRPVPPHLTLRIALYPLSPIGASLPRFLDHIVDPLLLERLITHVLYAKMSVVTSISFVT